MSLSKKAKQVLRRDSLLFIIIRSVYTLYCKTYQFGFSFLFRLFPVKKNKIIINNLHGKGYGDNSKYIVEKLLEKNFDCDIVWLLDGLTKEEAGLPNKIRAVRLGSIKGIYEMTTAKVWLESNRLSQYLFKRKNQYYIQTWHGGLGLKKIEGDAPYGMNKRNVSFAKRDSSMADLFISNSKHLSDIYRRAFWYEGEILESGFPKNDILFTDKNHYKIKIRRFYGLDEDIKILLYAPTFRENSKLDAYDIDFDKLYGALNISDTEKWTIMVKLHPNLSHSQFNKSFPGSVVNATSFPDMQELVMGIDILVTDYSSCMFDSAMANIPTFLYASDVEDYVDERGFYFTLDEIPFSLSENTTELISAIGSFNSVKYEILLKDFYKRVGLYDDGCASDKVTSKIMSCLNDC